MKKCRLIVKIKTNRNVPINPQY